MISQRLKNNIDVAWSFFLDTLFGFSPVTKYLESLEIGQIETLAERAPYEKDTKFTALFSYRDILVKQLIWQLKYRGSYEIGKKLGIILANNILEDLSEYLLFEGGKKFIIVPMPMSTNAYEKRGYNQAEILAEGMQCEHPEIFEIDTTILKKIKETSRQSLLKTKKERLENLSGAFSAYGDLKNKTIILIDDVYTTGKTFAEATRALKLSGTRKIHCYAFAH